MSHVSINELCANLELAERRAQILKALGNPVRLRVVALLCEAQELPVGEIAERLGQPQSTVSRQLSLLRLHGIVAVRKELGSHYYSVAMPQVLDLMSCVAGCGRRAQDG